eukprot:2565626-Amphidinium_carterae.1
MVLSASFIRWLSTTSFVVLSDTIASHGHLNSERLERNRLQLFGRLFADRGNQQQETADPPNSEHCYRSQTKSHGGSVTGGQTHLLMGGMDW